MLMNEDVHNIDDLFRDGIEGHEEAVPASVWEGVSHDLDIKQASFYKTKYIQLKRAARILALLCLFGGSYLVYQKLNEKPSPVQSTVTSPNNNTSKEEDRNETSNSTITEEKTNKELKSLPNISDNTVNAKQGEEKNTMSKKKQQESLT